MATKEEYEKALKEMNDAFYGITFLNSQTRRFDDNLNLLRELVNEHFEEKQETNLEHYYKDLLTVDLSNFNVINKRIGECCQWDCDKCELQGDCDEKRIEWLASPYKEPKYKLTQFEYDLINTYKYCSDNSKFNDSTQLRQLKEKEYFEKVDKNAKIHDILRDCEVIEDRKEVKK